MKYISTRSKSKASEAITSAQAILRGIAPDGGLYVPEAIPKFKLEELERLIPKRYEVRAVDVLRRFLTDYTIDELAECAELGYDWFDASKRAPLVVLLTDKTQPTAQSTVESKSDDASTVESTVESTTESADGLLLSGAPKEEPKPPSPPKVEKKVTGLLELWHGPTSAFKDMALHVLPHLMRQALIKTGETDQILILVATSGDTGKAALAGFADVPQTKIMVFYPEGGVSDLQRLQMVTQVGSNVNVTAVKGNFDDAQNGVKKIFGDKKIRAELEESGIKLSSANSINWGRLAPQIAYYVSVYVDLVESGQIKAGDKINMVVPTGNFGNILAAYYAKRMGLPLDRLICASNANHILTDFFRTGVYDRNREFYRTMSPSMDILISSNLERLLFHETGDPRRVKKMMDELSSTGRFKIDTVLKKKLDRIFYANFATEEETLRGIKHVFDTFERYIIDPHTAVGFVVSEKYRQETGDEKPLVIASTASPYKFAPSVLRALGVDGASMSEFGQLDRLNNITSRPIPSGLSKLDKATVLHKDVCEPSEMAEEVLAFARRHT